MGAIVFFSKSQSWLKAIRKGAQQLAALALSSDVD